MLKKTPFLIPKNKDGFIDYKSIYKVIYTDLKQPYGILDDLTVAEVSWMIEGNINEKKDFYEMISYAVKTAMASVYQGKDIKLFEEKEKQTMKITKEERQSELALLESKFGEL